MKKRRSNRGGGRKSSALSFARLGGNPCPLDPPGYAARVRELEDEGLTTSDAQGVADVEFGLVGRGRRP